MKKRLGIAVLFVVLLAYDYHVPHKPIRIINVSVISLIDAPQGNGWRTITVKMPDGSQQKIETITPFFYRAGYPAQVGVYERMLFPDIYDFVADGRRTVDN